MNRREFCRQLTMLGGTVMVAPLLNACRTADTPTPEAASPLAPQPGAGNTPVPSPTAVNSPVPAETAVSTAAPTPTTPPEASPPATQSDPTATSPAASGLASIALVKTTDRAAGVLRALALLAINPVRNLPVLLKPNLNSADAAPASTHPDVLRALALALQEMGARAITIGERSGMGDTRQVMHQTGVFDLAAALGLETAVFSELTGTDWVVCRSPDSHWPDGFAVPRILLEAACVVQTCNLKTHGYGGHFSLSLKNSVGFVARTTQLGGINYMELLHNSSFQREMIAEINTVYSPSLIVVDGVQAFVSGGPARGAVAQPEVILAGTDRVAIDAIGVAILRLFGTTPEVNQGKIFEQAQIARAVELGLGIDTPDKIQFLTDDDASRAFAERIREVLI